MSAEVPGDQFTCDLFRLLGFGADPVPTAR